MVDFVVFAAVFFPPAFATHSKSSLEEVNLCAKVMGKRGDGSGCWLWVAFDIRKTSPGAARFSHVKSGLDAKQLSIIWQSLQIETVTEGGAEFQLVVNLCKVMPLHGRQSRIKNPRFGGPKK